MLLTFFLHVKPDLLILVSGYSESLVNLFQNGYFITFSQCSCGQCFSTSYLYIKKD